MEQSSEAHNSPGSTFDNPPDRSYDGVRSTVIIGAGIMGCATAYYLSRSESTRPDTIHLVEASEELFASASGKAGGFLAKDWFGPATASLGDLSFRLHKELADEYDGGKAWGYSRSTGTSFAEGGGSRGSSSTREEDTDWLSRGASRAEVASERDPGIHEFFSEEDHNSGPSWLRRRPGDNIQSISEEGGVAQVDPLRLSQHLLTQSLLKGVHLHHPAIPLRIALDPTTHHLSGVHIRDTHTNSERTLPCTRLLLTAGAWTPRIFTTLFPTSPLTIPITPYAGHSIVLRSPRYSHSKQDACHALFTTMSSSGFSPEIFSRMGEEIYIAGLNSSSIPLPDLPGEAEIDPAAIAELMDMGKRLLGTEESGDQPADLKLVREGLCFRPVTRSGNPILAKVDDEKLSGKGRGAEKKATTLPSPAGGVFICAGHGPWGISHSLGSGKVMSEMLEGKKLSADVRKLGLR